MADVDAARKIQHFATRLIRLARTTAKGHALSSAQYSAMALLSAHPDIPLIELARRESVAHPTMSRLVNGLEKAGLAKRRRDPKDGRSSLLSLTEQGEHLYQEVAARRVQLFELLLAQLSPATVEEILVLAERSFLPIEDALRARSLSDM